jgi:hypothetical protein
MEYKASKVNGKKYIMQENGEIIGLYLTGRKKTYGLNDIVEIKSIAIPESEETANGSDDSLGTVNPDGTITLGKALGSTAQLQGSIIQILGDDDSADLIVRTKDNKLYSLKTEEVHLAGVSNATFNTRCRLFKSVQEWIDDLSDVCRKFDDLNRNKHCSESYPVNEIVEIYGVMQRLKEKDYGQWEDSAIKARFNAVWAELRTAFSNILINDRDDDSKDVNPDDSESDG